MGETNRAAGLLAMFAALMNTDPVGVPGPKRGQRTAKQHNGSNQSRRVKQAKTRGKTKHIGRSKRGG